MDFNPGELVSLKSGGPLMTVEQVGKDHLTQEDSVWCTWFEKVGNRQELHKETFHPVTLKKSEPPSVSSMSMPVRRG
jgi:uncharacterized protein YodC (DUF2158 family)